jgi:hypothetical protein
MSASELASCRAALTAREKTIARAAQRQREKNKNEKSC